jgi:hypothetical protein
VNVAVVPSLEQVLTVIDRDPVKPCAHAGLASKLTQFPEYLQKNIVRRILCLRGVTEQPQSQIVNGPGMFLIDGREFRRVQFPFAQGCPGFQLHTL